MRNFFESAFYLAAAVWFWGKIGSIALSLAVILYGCWRMYKFMKSTQLLRSHNVCH